MATAIFYETITGHIKCSRTGVDRSQRPDGTTALEHVNRVLAFHPGWSVYYSDGLIPPKAAEMKVAGDAVVRLTQDDKNAIEAARTRTMPEQVESLRMRLAALESKL